MGSSSAMGFGKTSLIPYIFHDKRSDSLNVYSNEELRLGCVDVIFGKMENSCSYVAFDVHGTMNTLNEDLITAIQHYCSVQVLCVTENDLHRNEFLTLTLNYSVDTRAKPTIVLIFDSNYNNKNYTSTKIVQDFQKQFPREQWPYLAFMAAPILKTIVPDSSFNNARRAQRLRQSFLECFHQLQASIEEQPPCESIFAIQAYYLATKSGTNVCPPPSYNITILSQLHVLFSDLNDKTQNLRLTTPVSYLDESILKCEKELSAQWHESSENIRAQLERFKQEYEKIHQIPQYTDFFISLLTNRPYVELLITEKYLEQWRAQFEPMLLEKMTFAKNEAMTHLSRIKQFEEQIQYDIEQKNEAELENVVNQVQLMKNEYKTHEKLIHDVEHQLANIDLTIGLFCDEILAVYDHYPKLFDINNLSVQLAQKFSELMYKGFAFHILRGRPLRCHSKLLQESLRHIQQSTKKTPLVLTVIGEQSSAKSSLLNSTFGCNFRVSAGRCTIGMYLSIVQWRDNTIVIFDTEGLLSLEESGSIFDNQMVSMAMLSSHIVLINHKGEFSSNLEHLVGMSFYAKLQIRSPLRPKLLFILRDQSDTLSTGIFFRQLSKFKENLYNNSKFLKSSIDDELEINDQNVVLLPNAFSCDTNPSLGIEQTWRNRTFPMKIVEFRKMIYESLTNVNLQVYTDIPHLYQKIVCNWNAIDKLGPNLLACKTLYELSVMNEMRDIANEIIVDCANKVIQEGRQHIDHVLANTASANQLDSDTDHYTEQFNTALQRTHQKLTDNAIIEFHSKTERTCFPLELKHKVEKMIEPPITYTQVMLRDEFGERLQKARRDARICSAQQRLLDAVQSDFDRNTNLPIEELKIRVETVYTVEVEACSQIVRPEYETPEQIMGKILRFYNTTVQSKTANTRHESIYNLLPLFEVHQFQKSCQRFDGTWECMVKREPQETRTGNRLFRALKKIFLGNPPDEYVEELWQCLHDEVWWWFCNPYNIYKNKKLLSSIFLELLPQLRIDINKLISERFQSSSDARLIGHMIDFIENLLNTDVIKRNRLYLAFPAFVSDMSLIALKILIDEAVKIEQQRQKLELEKAQNDLANWKETINMQIQSMQDSFEQGKNMAAIVAEEIFQKVGRVLLGKILHDVTADIVKNQFINHDAIQRQAYQESIVQADGEKILKYVLDINRFFLELSLREINTSLVTIIHKHMLNAEQMIFSVIKKANDTVQENVYDNLRLVADSIEQSIRTTPLFVGTADKKFVLKTIISLPIKNIDNFKRGFKTILLQTSNIRERITILTQNVKKDALAGCKIRLSRRLGCQSCCPGCGAKCSRSEPHDDELFQPWHECHCQPGRCKCRKSQRVLVSSHETSYHLAQAFHGTRYYRSNTPALVLCYQGWKTCAMVLSDNEEVFPLQKYYHLNHPEWYNNLNVQSHNGTACNETIPPADQRRAWMVVRRVLLRHYKRNNMVDNDHYDSKLYPTVNALPDDYEPKWNDTELN
ncbi:unnamed protein product [Adineta steineri]|uniref:VLIG-type G domain-containing protein n=1 Tax=Adineta steineri TaxID=433720 RepID=A0A815GU84_9BILA|nr:unnamed protein product [Adineta steineri]CAF3814369.1 unnamed protein product [Adineta steineri]